MPPKKVARTPAGLSVAAAATHVAIPLPRSRRRSNVDTQSSEVIATRVVRPMSSAGVATYSLSSMEKRQPPKAVVSPALLSAITARRRNSSSSNGTQCHVEHHGVGVVQSSGTPPTSVTEASLSRLRALALSVRHATTTAAPAMEQQSPQRRNEESPLQQHRDPWFGGVKDEWKQEEVPRSGGNSPIRSPFTPDMVRQLSFLNGTTFAQNMAVLRGERRLSASLTSSHPSSPRPSLLQNEEEVSHCRRSIVTPDKRDEESASRSPDTTASLPLRVSGALSSPASMAAQQLNRLRLATAAVPPESYSATSGFAVIPPPLVASAAMATPAISSSSAPTPTPADHFMRLQGLRRSPQVLATAAPTTTSSLSFFTGTDRLSQLRLRAAAASASTAPPPTTVTAMDCSSSSSSSNSHDGGHNRGEATLATALESDRNGRELLASRHHCASTTTSTQSNGNNTKLMQSLRMARPVEPPEASKVPRPQPIDVEELDSDLEEFVQRYQASGDPKGGKQGGLVSRGGGTVSPRPFGNISTRQLNRKTEATTAAVVSMSQRRMRAKKETAYGGGVKQKTSKAASTAVQQRMLNSVRQHLTPPLPIGEASAAPSAALSSFLPPSWTPPVAAVVQSYTPPVAPTFTRGIAAICVVMDTSTLLVSEPGVLNLLVEKWIVGIPYKVLDELDSMNKDKIPSRLKLSTAQRAEREWRTKRARELRNWIAAALARKDGSVRIQKREEVVEDYDRHTANNDDSILGFAVFLLRKRLHRVMFASEDKFLRIKAESELGAAYNYDRIRSFVGMPPLPATQKTSG